MADSLITPDASLSKKNVLMALKKYIIIFEKSEIMEEMMILNNYLESSFWQNQQATIKRDNINVLYNVYIEN
jgi:hypothetical protein